MLFDYSFDEYMKNFKNRIIICRVAFVVLFIMTISVSIFGFIFFSLELTMVILGLGLCFTFLPYLFCSYNLCFYSARYCYYYLDEDGVFCKVRIVPLGKYIDSTFNKVMFFLTANEKFLKQEYKIFKSFAIDLMKNKELSPEYVKEKYMDVEELRHIAKTKVEVFGHIEWIKKEERFLRVHYFNSRMEYFTTDIARAYNNLDEMVKQLGRL